MLHSLFKPPAASALPISAAGANRLVRRSIQNAAECLACRRASLPADPRPDAAARPRAAGDGYAPHRPSRAGIRQARQALPRRHQDHLQDHQPGDHLHRDRHGRVGGGAGQHTFARRPRADGRDRPIRDAVEGDGGEARPEARVHSRRLAHRRRCGQNRRASAQGQGARDQGGVRAAQRDRDRLPVARRADPQGDQRRRTSGAADGRYHLIARLDRLSPRRMGRRRHRRRRAEGADAAARHVVQCGERQGAGCGEKHRSCRNRSGHGKTC